MSETVSFEAGPNDTAYRFQMHIRPRASFWRRLWFLVSVIPRYLISGSVEVP